MASTSLRTTEVSATSTRERLRFNRSELAGAFGDLGTDLPLLVGMILAANLNAASVLVVFGCLQIWSGLWYRLPMPVQPLKAMAAIVIAQGASAATLYGAGLAIGGMMLLLAATGTLDWFVRWLPRSVVRGIQLGLGLQLASVALGRFVQADGARGYALAAVAFLLVVVLQGNRRVPAALPVVGLGIVYAFVFQADATHLLGGLGLHWPGVRSIAWEDLVAGTLLLALPQLPLSVANSVIATRQLIEDLFPNRRFAARRIGLTYAAMNLVAPWFGGVPVCHGSGGLAGHYAFGGRTGGSVVFYGTFFLLAGLFWGAGFEHVARLFPLPVLGILLLFEALALMSRVLDAATAPGGLAVALLVAAVSATLPYGYVIGIVIGTALTRLGWVPTWATEEVIGTLRRP